MMNNFGLFNSLVIMVSSLLLMVNMMLAPYNPYAEKNNPFECGFLSFIWQNRVQFSMSFFMFALLFLLFDLEVLLVFPYFVSTYTNDMAGLVSMVMFLLLLVIGFGFELGKKALKMNSKQLEITIIDVDEANKNSFVNNSSMTPLILTFIAVSMFLLVIDTMMIFSYLFFFKEESFPFNVNSDKICMWLKKNSLKFPIIPSVSLTSSEMVYQYTGVIINLEMWTPTSLFYCFCFSMFVVWMSSLDLNTDSFVSWLHCFVTKYLDMEHSYDKP